MGGVKRGVVHPPRTSINCSKSINHELKNIIGVFEKKAILVVQPHQGSKIGSESW